MSHYIIERYSPPRPEPKIGEGKQWSGPSAWTITFPGEGGEANNKITNCPQILLGRVTFCSNCTDRRGHFQNSSIRRTLGHGCSWLTVWIQTAGVGGPTRQAVFWIISRRNELRGVWRHNRSCFNFFESANTARSLVMLSASNWSSVERRRWMSLSLRGHTRVANVVNHRRPFSSRGRGRGGVVM